MYKIMWLAGYNDTRAQETLARLTFPSPHFPIPMLPYAENAKSTLTLMGSSRKCEMIGRMLSDMSVGVIRLQSRVLATHVQYL
jgi:hypothetical protein